MPSLHQPEQKRIHPLDRSSTAHAPARSYPGRRPRAHAWSRPRAEGRRLACAGSTPREQRGVPAATLTLLRTPLRVPFPGLTDQLHGVWRVSPPLGPQTSVPALALPPPLGSLGVPICRGEMTARSPFPSRAAAEDGPSPGQVARASCQAGRPASLCPRQTLRAGEAGGLTVRIAPRGHASVLYPGSFSRTGVRYSRIQILPLISMKA